jgi:Domain of unknown function (DUF1330)
MSSLISLPAIECWRRTARSGRITSAKGGHHIRLFRRRTRDHQPGRGGALPGGGRRHDRALWRPLPGPRRRNRTDRGRTGAQTHVILEFADKAAFKRWYDSPEYQKILPGRLDNSTGRAFIVEGAS